VQNLNRAADEATTTTTNNGAKLTQSKSKRRPEGARLVRSLPASICSNTTTWPTRGFVFSRRGWFEPLSADCNRTRVA
jgi:hypothetical protein